MDAEYINVCWMRFIVFVEHVVFGEKSRMAKSLWDFAYLECHSSDIAEKLLINIRLLSSRVVRVAVGHINGTPKKHRQDNPIHSLDTH